MDRKFFSLGIEHYLDSVGLADLEALWQLADYGVGTRDMVESYVMGFEYTHMKAQFIAERIAFETKHPGCFPWVWHRLWGNNPAKVTVGGPIG